MCLFCAKFISLHNFLRETYFYILVKHCFMQRICQIICYILLCTMPISVMSQDNDTSYIEKIPLKKFYIDGTYQALIYVRDFNTLFDGKQSQQKLVIGNSDGGEYRSLRLNFSGRPTSSTFFKTDLYVAPEMKGFGYNATSSLGIEIGVNLEGQISLDKANIFMKFGGTQFTKLSKLTLWSTENKGESMFERGPWGGFQEAGQNYESYYSQGTISRDFTWGNKFLQGFTADITQLPYNLESKVIFAKTPNNGGQTSYTETIPDMSYGAMIRKRFKSHSIGVNSFNALTKDSETNGNTIGYNIITSDFSVNMWHNDLTIAGELGTCKYIAQEELAVSWGNAYDITILSREKIAKAPITFHYFHIEPKFINLEAGYNTFLKNVSTNYNGEGGSGNPIGAYMSDIDLINGNRKGGDVRVEYNIHGLKLNLAAGISQEIEHLTNVISYTHLINNIMFARVYPYQSLFGVSNSLNTTFRGYYETSSINTAHPDYTNSKLHFSVAECNLKYKITAFSKPLYLFYLTSFSSTQDFISALPVFSDKAYMRVQYHEFEAYYKVAPKVALASYFGLETMKGNSLMQLGTAAKDSIDPTTNEYISRIGNPTDVLGYGVGLGIDYDISHVANLYIRARYFDYADRKNTYYMYKGFEGTIELRIYF